MQEEREGVEVRRHVAGHPGVDVLRPGSAQALGLLQDYEVLLLVGGNVTIMGSDASLFVDFAYVLVIPQRPRLSASWPCTVRPSRRPPR